MGKHMMMFIAEFPSPNQRKIEIPNFNNCNDVQILYQKLVPTIEVKVYKSNITPPLHKKWGVILDTLRYWTKPHTIDRNTIISSEITPDKQPDVPTEDIPNIPSEITPDKQPDVPTEDIPNIPSEITPDKQPDVPTEDISVIPAPENHDRELPSVCCKKQLTENYAELQNPLPFDQQYKFSMSDLEDSIIIHDDFKGNKDNTIIVILFKNDFSSTMQIAFFEGRDEQLLLSKIFDVGLNITIKFVFTLPRLKLAKHLVDHFSLDMTKEDDENQEHLKLVGKIYEILFQLEERHFDPVIFQILLEFMHNTYEYDITDNGSQCAISDIYKDFVKAYTKHSFCSILTICIDEVTLYNNLKMMFYEVSNNNVLHLKKRKVPRMTHFDVSTLTILDVPRSKNLQLRRDPYIPSISKWKKHLVWNMSSKVSIGMNIC
jgi:hypothetical protein